MSNAKTVLMFSGQGSQYFQMGRELFDRDPVFRDWMIRLDRVVQELSGNSVIKVLYAEENNKSASFDRTALTHPAIFMVEYSLARSLIQKDVVPSLVLGASLGTFAAAAIAGFLDAEDALIAVVRQATMFEACCEAGIMVAILANPEIFFEGSISQRSQLAAVNFASHFVVSARLSEWDSIESYLRKRGVTFQKLPVSFAFHSQWIDGAQRQFESFMHSIVLKEGTVPLACCARADVLSELRGDHFWQVVRKPIQFRETISSLEQQGTYRYIDAGPAGTLATFLKYGLPKSSTSTIHSVMTPYGRDLKNMIELATSQR